MKTVNASELSNLRMAAGNERKYTKVIRDDHVCEWVGIGWIEVGEPTEEDRKRYPVVVFHVPPRGRRAK